MPWWKYVSNRLLTFAENFLIGAKLSEYHTGYSACFPATRWSACHYKQIQMILSSIIRSFVYTIALGAAIGEVTCPARYMPESVIMHSVEA